MMSSEIRSDVTEYARAVGELIRLAKALPDGMERLKAFTVGGGPFCVAEVVQTGAAAVCVSRPTPGMAALIEAMRADVRGVVS